MRPNRTDSEQNAISNLNKMLTEQGCDVHILPEITDRPDAVFKIEDKVIAIECRIITSERLMKLYGKKLQEGKVHQLYLPLEPHIWLQEAIAAKNPKIPEYISRSGASSVWLVVHSCKGMFSNLPDLYTQGLSDLFHMAAVQTPHSFDRIYITGECDFNPICIFDKKDALETHKKYREKRVISIPIQRYFFAKITATQGPNGHGQISINMRQSEQVQYFLQPLDKNFRVDYTYLKGLSTEDAAMNDKFNLLIALPK